MNTTYIVQIHVIHTMITVNNGVGILLFEVNKLWSLGQCFIDKLILIPVQYFILSTTSSLPVHIKKPV